MIDIDAEHKRFEERYPRPDGVAWAGRRYAVMSDHPRAMTYCARWDGWIEGARLAERSIERDPGETVLTKQQAIDMFGGTGAKLGQALGITRQRISQWPEVLDQQQTDWVIGAAYRLGKEIPAKIRVQLGIE